MPRQEDKYDLLVDYIVNNQNKFYHLALSYTNRKEDALDIVQNAVCKALENYLSIKNMDHIKTWFYRVLVNESLTYVKKYRKEILIEEIPEQEITYEKEEAESASELLEEINRLSFDLQNIIKLYYFEELTLKEIAVILDMNLNTVKAKLYRGLKKLRQELKEDFA